MSILENRKIKVGKPFGDIHTFLSDFKNFEKLLPEEVTDWNATENTCSFVVKGIIPIELEISENIPPQKIVYKSTGKTPVVFSIYFDINPLDELSSDVELAIDADLNPFMKTIVEKPLKTLLDIIGSKLNEDIF